MDPICPRPTEAVAELAEMLPGLGSVRNERACNNDLQGLGEELQSDREGQREVRQGRRREPSH